MEAIENHPKDTQKINGATKTKFAYVTNLDFGSNAERGIQRLTCEGRKRFEIENEGFYGAKASGLWKEAQIQWQACEPTKRVLPFITDSSHTDADSLS